MRLISFDKAGRQSPFINTNDYRRQQNLMINHGNEIKIFSGNSNRPLAEKIAAHLNTSLGEMEVTHFSDGEGFYVVFQDADTGETVKTYESWKGGA